MRNVFVCLAICILHAAWISSLAGADTQLAGPLDSWLARVSAARRAADRPAEVDALVRVLELDPTHPATHARLAELSGPAPRSEFTPTEAQVRRAMDHPYDPAALLDGGEAFARKGRIGEAIELLEKVVWLADKDPASALDALLMLRELSPDWRARRVVPVHVYADVALRSSVGWRFALRTAWLSASHALDTTLETRFVPIVIAAFDPQGLDSRGPDPQGEGDDLDAVYRDFVAKVPPPEEGILAVITGRPVPDLPGVWKKGIAELLGRSLAIRMAPGATQSRVLSHELLHLYGAIHVLDDAESLMNPTGTSLKLDAGSYQIARAMRGRSFGPGGIERNVLSVVDLRHATNAYIESLNANLSYRDAGIAQAQQLGVSRQQAANRAQRATSLDPHFADAARIVAVLMIADSRRAEALKLLELAAKLYPADSKRGQQAAQEADALRRGLVGPEAGVANRGM